MAAQQKIFIAVLITSFMGPFMGSAINIAIPDMAFEFCVPAPALSWVVTAYLLGSVALLVPFGRLADIMGRRKLYVRGTTLVALTTFAGGLMPDVPSLVVCRFLQGMALATIFSTGMAMLVASHRPQERGRVIGYSAAATYIGLSMGPVLGGFITECLGWRLIFFLAAFVQLVSAWLASRVQEEWYGNRTGGMDRVGCLLYIAGSVMSLLGLSAGAAHPAAPWLLAAGIVLLVLFVLGQRRSPAPLIDVTLFHNTLFAMSNLAALLNYSATFAISFLLSLYLQLVRGLDASLAGCFILLQPLVMAFLSPKAGMLSDRYEPRILASIGMILTTLGIFGFSFLQPATPFWLIGLDFVLVGIGFAFFSSPNSNAIMGAVAPRFYGVASSVLALMRLSGQAVSMAVVTFLLTVYTLPAVSPDYLTSLLMGMQHIFLLLALSCAVGAGVSLLRGKR